MVSSSIVVWVFHFIVYCTVSYRIILKHIVSYYIVSFFRRIVPYCIVLHCYRNGAEKCGLLVVLLNVLEISNVNGEVSIPQVIRHLKLRRQQIIPNFVSIFICNRHLFTFMLMPLS